MLLWGGVICSPLLLVPHAQAADEQHTIAQLKKTASGLRQDGAGNLIEVNFRGSAITDQDLVPLPRLPKLRSVLLNDTQITDAGLATLGQIRSLENLDLRGCGITNRGIAFLSGLNRLKALRLSGKNGRTQVDDGGLAEIGKLQNLKALLHDYLWISDEGLAH